MKYLLLLVLAIIGCANPEPDNIVIYDHTAPRQLGKVLPRTLIGGDSTYQTKWVFFENYTMALDYENGKLLGVEIDHANETECTFELTDCCFDIVIDHPDTCWWWQQLPNHIRSEISSRKIDTN